MSDLKWQFGSDLSKSKVCNFGGVKNKIDTCRPEVCLKIFKKPTRPDVCSGEKNKTEVCNSVSDSPPTLGETV